jgi:hypothetical protein
LARAQGVHCSFFDHPPPLRLSRTGVGWIIAP